jgi:hypothetical protein
MRSSYGHRVHDKPKEKKQIVIEKRKKKKKRKKKEGKLHIIVSINTQQCTIEMYMLS